MLGDLFLVLESCVAYIKRGVVGARTLGKRKCHSDTREPGPHNRT